MPFVSHILCRGRVHRERGEGLHPIFLVEECHEQLLICQNLLLQ